MGCLRAMFVQVGCVVLLVVALVLGFIYRDQVTDAYRRLRGLPPRSSLVFVGPAPGGADRAGAAIERLARPSGPAWVDIGAAELAALIERALAAAGGRTVLDSIAVSLGRDEVRVRGSLDVTGLPRAIMGPLSGAIGPREPIELGGALGADSAGAVMWTLTAMRVRDFPFPRATIPAIVRTLRLPGAEGPTVPLPGPRNVGDVRVREGSVRLYRMTAR